MIAGNKKIKLEVENYSLGYILDADLDRAERLKERLVILEALEFISTHIKEIIDIMMDEEINSVKEIFRNQYKMSELQAQAIVDVRLRILTQREMNKCREEYVETLKKYRTFKLCEKLKG